MVVQVKDVFLGGGGELRHVLDHQARPGLRQRRVRVQCRGIAHRRGLPVGPDPCEVALATAGGADQRQLALGPLVLGDHRIGLRIRGRDKEITLAQRHVHRQFKAELLRHPGQSCPLSETGWVSGAGGSSGVMPR